MTTQRYYAVVVEGVHLYGSDDADTTEKMWREHQKQCTICSKYDTIIEVVLETTMTVRELPALEAHGQG